MENKKGTGIFLGVVSVATLIVAIIGATFAFFSATITGDNDVNLTAYEFNASLSISPVYSPTGSNLIPMDPSVAVGETGQTNLLYAINSADVKCVDSNGFQVCSVYSVTFNNQSNSAISLTGTLKTISNDKGSADDATGFKNLKFVELGGSVDSFTISDTVVDISSESDGTASIGTVTVPANGTETRYFAVYLNEAEEDNNSEMGAQFQGQLIYTSATGGQQLTGTFIVG